MDTAGWDPYAIGIYWRLLMYEWINDGLPNELEQLARIGGAKLKKFNQNWNQFISTKFSVNGTGKLINKRMEQVRENQLKYSESRRKNVSIRYKDKPTYEPTHEEHMNLHTPRSSSSSSSSNKEKKYIKKRKLSDEEWIEEIKKINSWVDWDQLNREMDTWLLNNPKRQKTRKFVTNWILNKQKDKPVEIQKSTKPIEPVKYVDRDGSIGEWDAKPK